MNTSIWLRIEGAVELAGICWLYHSIQASWILFAVLFLVPDIAMLGYLAGPRLGAWCYNTAHTYSLSIPLAIAGWIFHEPIVLAIGLIWCGHIAFDRMMGYGLKSADSFNKTHLDLNA